MGKQITFYMTPKDRDEFLSVVQAFAPTVVALRDADVAAISPSDRAEIGSGKTLVLWNPALCSSLQRTWIDDPGYFRVDTLREPALEYMPSISATWKREAALLQGRLFGNFESYLGKPEGFHKWYESLARWIRKNYSKNSNNVGGYIGPGAKQLVADGVYLLPSFVPPETPEWQAELDRA